MRRLNYANVMCILFFNFIFYVSIGYSAVISADFYYRSDTHTINGETDYQFKTANSSVDVVLSSGSFGEIPGIAANFSSDVIIRHSNGTETIIGSSVAVNSLSYDGLIQAEALWNCPDVLLSSGDAIKIVEKIYSCLEGCIGTVTRGFITEQMSQFQAFKLVSSQWLFIRFIEHYTYIPPMGIASVRGRFYHGGPTYYSRVRYIKYETDELPPTPNPAQMQSVLADSSSQITWTAVVGNDPYNVSYSFSGSAWNYNRVYVRTGLSENTKYSNNVRMGDDLGHIGGASGYIPCYTKLNSPIDTEFTIDQISTNSVQLSVSTPPNSTAGQTGCKFTNIIGGAQGGLSQIFTGKYVYTNKNLQPNTLYSYRVKYKNGDGVYSGFNPTSKLFYTLPARPKVNGDILENVGANSFVIHFTNKNIFKQGGVEYYQYNWTLQSNYNFIGNEIKWTNGILNCDILESGKWYLHLVSYNKDGITNVHKKYGPYLFDINAMPVGQVKSTNISRSKLTWVANSIQRASGVWYQFEGTINTSWQTTNIIIISNLAPNTICSQRVKMKDGINEGNWGPYRYKYTLPASPSLNSDKSSGIIYHWPINEEFIFTNKNAFGQGGVEYYRYRWLQGNQYTFIGNEEKWGQGMLILNGHSAKSPTWYLHIQSYNGGNDPGDNTVLGPYGSYNIMQDMKLANYPNPFNPNKEKTTIEWYLENDSKVKMVIYSVNGEIVKTWDYVSGQTGGRVGSNKLEWDGRNKEGYIVGNGIYFCYIYHSSEKQMIKIAVVK